MNRATSKVLLSLLIGGITLGSTGCNLDKISTISSIEEIVSDDTFDETGAHQADSTENVVTDVESEEQVESEVVEDNRIDDIIGKLNITSIDIVTTNLRTLVVNNEGGVIGYLGKGVSMKSLGQVDSNTVKIQYYDQEGYVDVSFVTQSTVFDVTSNFNKVLYSTSDVTMTVPSYLSNTGAEEIVCLPYHEVFEVFDENDSYYVVRNNNHIGYMSKDNLEELTGTFVVVDISDQNLKLYSDNQIILNTPVVTGKETTPTHEGLFAVYSISHNRYLTGPGYKSWVDYFFAFNDGEGLHDAEYHTCDAIGDHGWRNARDFGGETYIRSGSHGCVNMLHDAVRVVDQYVYMDMPVLVKK